MSVRYKDYYKVLGVEKTATKDEIRKAYRALARKWHPDQNKDPEASKRFQEINEANEVLSDPEKRARYDQIGSGFRDGQDFRPPPGFDGFEFEFAGGGPRGGAGSFSDFFSMLFGQHGGPFAGAGAGARQHRAGPRPRHGEDLEAEIELTLQQALAGGKHTFAFQTMVSRADGTVGEETRRIELKIPDGVKEGTRIRLAGQGGPGRGGGPSGDLLLRVRFAQHPVFSADGHDLRADLPVRAVDAVLGGKASITTLDGREATLTIAAGTQSGSMLRMRGQGLPRGDGTRGDLLLRVRIEIPRALSDEERAAWERLRDMDTGTDAGQ
jgi:curved DNA-binding protein